MVEYYAITVWSFSAFYNNRKIGARGTHRAAPVSRYMPCAWSSNSGSTLMRMVYSSAMYSAYAKKRISYGSGAVGEYSAKNHEPQRDYIQKIDYSFKYTPQKFENSESFFAGTHKTFEPEIFVTGNKIEAEKIPSFGKVCFATPRANYEYSNVMVGEKFSVVTNIPVEKIVENKREISQNVFISNSKNLVFEKERTVAYTNRNENNYSRERIISLINSVSTVPVRENYLNKLENKYSDRLENNNISKNKYENISKNKNPNKLPAVCENRVKIKNEDKKLNVNRNPLRYRLGNGIAVCREDILFQKDAYKFVEKIVNKLKRSGKKMPAQKIIEYSLSYAKEKKHELFKKNLSLWRILWARINGKLLMLIIDDVSKVIVGVGLFASFEMKKALEVVSNAIEKYGAPKAVVNYENILFCAKNCANIAYKTLETYLNKEGIEYLASIIEEGAAFLRARNLIEYVWKNEEFDSFESFVNLYNLRGIKEVGGVNPALYSLQAE